MNKDTIYRQDAIDAISCNITVTGRQNAEVVAATIGAFADRIKALPSAQPEPIKINIDHELTKDEYERLRKDMADAPIVLFSSAQHDVPDICVGDIISRQDVIDVLSQYPFEKVVNCISIIEEFPSAQSEIIRCKDCRYSVDEYDDGDCYCKRSCSWHGANWDFYCAAAERREE